MEPDLERVILLALVLGLGLGCASALIMEGIDTTYKLPEEVESELHLPVLTSIPILYTQIELKRLRRRKLAAFVGVATGFILSTVAIVFALKGASETVDFVKRFLSSI